MANRMDVRVTTENRLGTYLRGRRAKLDPAALRRKAQRGRIELGPAIFQISPERISVGDGLVHPVSHYTTIKSLLYYDSPSAEICLQRNVETRLETCACICLSLEPPAGSARPSLRI